MLSLIALEMHAGVGCSECLVILVLGIIGTAKLVYTTNLILVVPTKAVTSRNSRPVAAAHTLFSLKNQTWMQKIQMKQVDSVKQASKKTGHREAVIC